LQAIDGVTSPTSARYLSMMQAIKNDAVLRKLEAMERAIGLEKRAQVATARQELALFVNLGADDPLSASLSRVYHLSGKWTRAAVDIGPADVQEAIEKAKALLQS
jgi:hypothetical protein